MKTIWMQAEHPQFKTLKGDKTADVLIIGGGITGVLCAFALENAGVDYILLEGKKILSGNTSGTTAKITAGHSLIYDKIISRYGEEIAKKYYFANISALNKYKYLSKNIECDFEEKDFLIYSKNNYDKLQKELSALRRIGAEAEFTNNIEIPIKTIGAIKYSNQALFNPLKLLYSLSEGLNIYENSFVKDIKENIALTENGSVRAKKIIFASHFPFINKYGMYFLKLYQHRSFVVALENAPQYSGIYVDEDRKGFSFRNYNDYLLVSGGASRTGKQDGGFEAVKQFCKNNYPTAIERFRFAAQDCMSLDGIPYIGRYSPSKPNFFVATGFNKWGMTSAYVASEILCDMVTGKHNELEEVFSPKRNMFSAQLFVNLFETIKNVFTPTVPRCPHLGCALKWNKEEQTWDCPCHGSRFDKNGKLLDNPSKRNMS